MRTPTIGSLPDKLPMGCNAFNMMVRVGRLQEDIKKFRIRSDVVKKQACLACIMMVYIPSWPVVLEPGADV